jgi:hypothetical protein
MLPEVLGGTPVFLTLIANLLDVCYDVCEGLVVRLHKSSNIEGKSTIEMIGVASWSFRREAQMTDVIVAL